MARYPANPGRWATTVYGGNEDAWEEAKAQCRRALYRCAADCTPRTYTELTLEVTAIPWPDGAYTHAGQQMGFLLGQVSLEELDRVEDRPLLSSLVIGKDEGMPSMGYWTFRRDLGVQSPISDLERLELWTKEFEAAC